MTRASWDVGLAYGMMAAPKSMRPRRRGQIIQIGSALAYRGIPLQSAYCDAKHAIRGFTASLRREPITEGSGISLTIWREKSRVGDDTVTPAKARIQSKRSNLTSMPWIPDRAQARRG